MNAYLSAMRRYATFQGRASRAEFWLFTLAMGIIVFVALVIDNAFISGPNSRSHPFAGLIVLAHLLPALAVSVRRLHDTDRSGWWVLINLIPLGSVVLFVFACLPGTPGPNQYGRDPLGDMTVPSWPLSPGAAATTAPVQRDVIAEVERLSRLKAEGSLSEAEFDVLKAQALGRGGRA